MRKQNEQRTGADHRTRAASVTGDFTVGSGVKINGDVNVPGSMFVYGQFSGKVVAKDIFVGEEGSLTGDIVTENIEVLGTVSNNLKARGTLTLRSTASLTGKIAYGVVQIEEGARLSGVLNTLTGDEPVTEAVQEAGNSGPVSDGADGAE